MSPCWESQDTLVNFSGKQNIKEGISKQKCTGTQIYITWDFSEDSLYIFILYISISMYIMYCLLKLSLDILIFYFKTK